MPKKATKKSPRKAESDLAAELIQMIAKKFLGDLAQKLIGDPIMDILNLKDKSAEAFRNEVLSKLEQINQQLVAMQESIRQIDLAIAGLKRHIDSLAFSSRLNDYFDKQLEIETVFNFYLDDLIALGSGNAKRATTGLADMFIRLSPPQDKPIAVTMESIHGLLAPSLPGIKSLFSFMMDAINDRMGAYVDNPRNYQFLGAWGSGPGSVLPVQDGIWSCRMIVSESHSEATNFLVNSALPVFQHILLVQLKGLILLSRAWSGGPHERQLGKYVTNVKKQIGLMQRFVADTVGPTIDKGMPALLQRGKKPLKVRADAGASSGLNDDWIMWDGFAVDFWAKWIHGQQMPLEREYLYITRWVMINKPWEPGVRPVLILQYNQRSSLPASFARFRLSDALTYPVWSPADFVKHPLATLWKRHGVIALDPSGEAGIQPHAYDRTAPTQLNDFLKGLPASVSRCARRLKPPPKVRKRKTA